MISKIRNYAPYVYLAHRIGGGYDFYILVPVEPGKTVNFPLKSNLSSTNKEIVINAKVVNGIQNILEVGEEKFAKKYYALDGLSDVERITIFVKNGDFSNYRNTYLTANADATSADVKVDGLATNCPYAYLATQSNNIFPRLLIPIFNASYTKDAEKVSLAQGLCTISIVLSENNLKTSIAIIAPELTNATAYPTANFNRMEYEVSVSDIVLENSSAVSKKKKGKKEAAESD